MCLSHYEHIWEGKGGRRRSNKTQTLRIYYHTYLESRYIQATNFINLLSFIRAQLSLEKHKQHFLLQGNGFA